jgi:hypothetical protein
MMLMPLDPLEGGSLKTAPMEPRRACLRRLWMPEIGDVTDGS